MPIPSIVGAGYEVVRIMCGTPILMRGAAIMGVIGFPIAITGLRAITGRLIWVGAASGRISGRMLSVNILNAQGGLAPFELERLRDQ